MEWRSTTARSNSQQQVEMEAAKISAETLRNQIAATEKQLQELRDQLAGLESLDKADAQPPQPREHVQLQDSREDDGPKWPLTQEEYNRYGRQMIVSGIGIQGQLRLRAASVLIVGAGGLGCPAAVYIAGAGVKTLGLVDGDTVEVSNLHRQILHSSKTVDMWKVDSAIQYLKTFNPNVTYNAYREHLSPENAISIVSQYDLVLDCTDHPKSRYLISDACILLCKPLISASALKTDGQQMNLNYPPRPVGDPTGGPCYRCVYPKPPPADQVVSCGDGGIVGPVVGAMGVLQALEAIKLIVAGVSVADTTRSEFDTSESMPPPSLLIFSSNSSNPFRYVRLRSRRPDCFACSASAELSFESLTSGSLDYVAFCGEVMPVKLLSPDERVSATEYARLKEAGKKEHVLVDVREKVQFDICSIPGSINVPFSSLQGGTVVGFGQETEPNWLPPSLSDSASIYVVCRLGMDSQVVTKQLKEAGLDRNGKRYVGDIHGGLRAWRDQVDSSWPDY